MLSYLQMDIQFHSNTMNSNTSRYSSLPGISPHQLQHNSSVPTHTIPPLHPSPHSSMQPVYSNSAPQTPRTLATPNTPTSGAPMNYTQMCQTSSRYQLIPNGSQQTHGYQMISNGNDQGYRTITTVVPPTSGTTTMSYPQAITPAPQNRKSQTLRPLSQGGLHMQGTMQSPYGQNTMLHMTELESPTHVVGSQGRRGILPSAPGRPPVNSNTGKSALIPAKDAQGKFPCPHCTKTYLHAKHLKRHLLRHTGDRPYMCILCRDTFSRSDILKRHFQKCSIRRGNPTGASHLSHSQAHLKKSHTTPQKSLNESNVIDMNGISSSNGAMAAYRIAPDITAPSEVSSSFIKQEEKQLHLNESKQLSITRSNDGRNLVRIKSEDPNRGNMNPNFPGTNPTTLSPGMNRSLIFNTGHQ